jgi:hypothetical protein
MGKVRGYVKKSEPSKARDARDGRKREEMRVVVRQWLHVVNARPALRRQPSRRCRAQSETLGWAAAEEEASSSAAAGVLALASRSADAAAVEIRRVAVGGESSRVGDALLLLDLLLLELGGRVDSGGRGVSEEELDVWALDDLGEGSGVDVPYLDKVGVEGEDPGVVEG